MNASSEKQLSPRQFICDSMLKGLAKWLRFLGFPTEISSDSEQIQRRLLSEPNTLFLTRSPKNALNLPSEAVLLLQSDEIAVQLQELNERLAIFQHMNPLSLCSVCNIPIEPVEKEKIKGEVPERVWEQFEEFWRCPHCQRIYWEGGHVNRLLDKLRRMGVPV